MIGSDTSLVLAQERYVPKSMGFVSKRDDGGGYGEVDSFWGKRLMYKSDGESCFLDVVCRMIIQGIFDGVLRSRCATLTTVHSVKCPL